MITRLRRRFRAWRHARYARRIDRFWNEYLADVAKQRADCERHTHSAFFRCVNGLTLGDYLSRPRTEPE